MAENSESSPQNDAVPYSPEWLNALSDAERQSVAMSDFSRSMHNSGGEHVAWLLWSTQEKDMPTPLEYRQGSMFFLDCGRGPFAVTAGHVFEQFVKDRAERRVRGYQLGNIGFDLEERLIDWGHDRKIDLATFKIRTSVMFHPISVVLAMPLAGRVETPRKYRDRRRRRSEHSAR